MIKIVHRNGRYFPVVVCDICKKIITEAENAAIVHIICQPSGDFLGEESFVDVLHVHKEDCLEIGEYSLGGRANTGWVELRMHLGHLVSNAGMDWEAMQQIFTGSFPAPGIQKEEYLP